MDANLCSLHCEDHMWCCQHYHKCGSQVARLCSWLTNFSWMYTEHKIWTWWVENTLKYIKTNCYRDIWTEVYPSVLGEFTGYLLGDRGYPCLPYLLTPYPDPEPGPQQRYNLAHCRTRARVEMTIGMLKARFQCLQRLRVTPERACDIIVACVILHNIATIRGEHCPSEPNISSDPNHEHPDPPTDIQDGRAVRDTICHNHFLWPITSTCWKKNKQIFCSTGFIGRLYFLYTKY